MSFSVEGRTAIVTGAACGIGLAIAQHLVGKGANVMFVDMDEGKLDAEIGDAARAEGQVRMFTGDLREKLTVTNLLSATVDAFDRIDILVNASRQIALSDPLNPDEDQVEAMLHQNLLASLRVSQLTAKRMIAMAAKAGREGAIGSIVNISSIAAHRAQPELLGYSVACAAQDQMTRSLAVALAPKGIRVNSVAMGSVLSASLQSVLREHPDFRDRITAATPLGRVAEASELVETVQYLASDASGFMTGQVIALDGGRGLMDPVQIPAH